MKVKIEVLQGTGLGHVLFNRCTNELAKTNINSKIISYADDSSSIVLKEKNIEQC